MIHAPKDYLPCSCPGAPKIQPTELDENEIVKSRLSMKRCPCYKPRRVRFQTIPEIKYSQDLVPCNLPDIEIEVNNNENNKFLKASPEVVEAEGLSRNMANHVEKPKDIPKFYDPKPSSRIPTHDSPASKMQELKLTSQDDGIHECSKKLTTLRDKQKMWTQHSMKRYPCFNPREEFVEEEVYNEDEKSKKTFMELEGESDFEAQIIIETKGLPVPEECEYEIMNEEEKENDYELNVEENFKISYEVWEREEYSDSSAKSGNTDCYIEETEMLASRMHPGEGIGSVEELEYEIKVEITTPYNSSVPSSEISTYASSLKTGEISYESCRCELDFELSEKRNDICKCIKHSWRSQIQLPTIGEFSERKCTDALYKILEMARFNEQFAYSVRFEGCRRDGTLDVYKYVTTFSIPTKTSPVPKVTASLYFVIVVDRANSPDRPVQVFYSYEYFSSLTNILNMAPSKVPIFAIMKIKRSIYKNEFRFYA